MSDVHCNLVNLTANTSHTWILDLILQGEQSLNASTQNGAAETISINSDVAILNETSPVNIENIVKVNLKTKYYTASVNLNHCSYSDLSKQRFDETEALLIYCEGTRDCLNKADKVWQLAKENEPAVCLFIIDSTEDTKVDEGDVTRTEIMSWCLSNHFELVECDEVAEDDCSDGDESGGIVDIVGRGRILEAMKSHTWSTMELLEPPTLMSSKSQSVKEKKPQRTPSASLEESVDSFEALFSELAVIKAKADNLPTEGEKRAFAEKIALSFYAAMGGDDGPDTDED